jgi:hypothetical protein
LTDINQNFSLIEYLNNQTNNMPLSNETISQLGNLINNTHSIDFYFSEGLITIVDDSLEATPGNTHAPSLSLSSPTPEDFKLITDSLKTNQSLIKIGIVFSDINHGDEGIRSFQEDEGMKIFLSGIVDHPTLQEIKIYPEDVENSDFFAAFTSYLVGKIHQKLNTTQLKSLNLHSCQIGDSGLVALAPILPILSDLNISNIEVNETAFIALLNATEDQIHLTNLNIDLVNLGELGIRRLAEFLTKTTTLEHLALSENYISNEGFRHIITALKANNSLRSITFGYDPDQQQGGLTREQEIELALVCLNSNIKIIGNFPIVHEVAGFKDDFLKFYTFRLGDVQNESAIKKLPKNIMGRIFDNLGLKQRADNIVALGIPIEELVMPLLRPTSLPISQLLTTDQEPVMPPTVTTTSSKAANKLSKKRKQPDSLDQERNDGNQNSLL